MSTSIPIRLINLRICPTMLRMFGHSGKSIYFGSFLPESRPTLAEIASSVLGKGSVYDTVFVVEAASKIEESFLQMMPKENGNAIIHYYCPLASNQARWLATQSRFLTAARNNGDPLRVARETPLIVSLLDSAQVEIHQKTIFDAWRDNRGVPRNQ